MECVYHLTYRNLNEIKVIDLSTLLHEYKDPAHLYCNVRHAYSAVGCAELSLRGVLAHLPS